eukprot:scaffold587_cov339-Prasinococcus_capsulatus_cf.AAC.11
MLAFCGSPCKWLALKSIGRPSARSFGAIRRPVLNAAWSIASLQLPKACIIIHMSHGQRREHSGVAVVAPSRTRDHLQEHLLPAIPGDRPWLLRRPPRAAVSPKPASAPPPEVRGLAVCKSSKAKAIDNERRQQ